LAAGLGVTAAPSALAYESGFTLYGPSPDMNFGKAGDVSGSTVAVGSPDPRLLVNSPYDPGKVHLYNRTSSGSWASAAQLLPSDTAAGDGFGRSVALEGDLLVVGSGYPGHLSDAYVYVRPSTGWVSGATENARLAIPPDASAFGAVGVSSDQTIFVSGAGSGTGKIYVYVAPSGGWAAAAGAEVTSVAELVPSDGRGGPFAVSSQTVVMGLPDNNLSDDVPGEAAVFVRPSSGWTGTIHELALLRSGAVADVDDDFGWSVGIHGRDVVVGAPRTTVGSNANQGAIYVFTPPSLGWFGTRGPQATLTASDGVANDYLGQAVAVDTDVVGLGDGRVVQNRVVGEAYKFARPGATWDAAGSRTQTFAYGTGFHDFAAYDAGTALFGRWWFPNAASWASAVTVYQPDADADGHPDIGDNCPYVANIDQADFDGDGQGDVCDSDDDGDSVADTADNCPYVANTDQANHDADAVGDACDVDDDGDSVADTSDNCPLVGNTDQADLDGDGQGDVCDPDDDGDSVADTSDNCPRVVNASQADLDNDGAGDRCDSASNVGLRILTDKRKLDAKTVDVAILGRTWFDPVSRVNRSSVRFGRTGTEAAPLSCAGADVNGDGVTDLVCRFNGKDGRFTRTSTTGTLTGRTTEGDAFSGTGTFPA